MRVRALRARHLPDDLFAEFAWVLLLRAYLRRQGADAEPDGEPVPPLDGQVMRHWRRYLEQQELIVPTGARCEVPVLAADGLARMERYLDRPAATAGAPA